ncbi:MAG: FecR domain-containing protein [Spirochaetales bacterium]|nr:FecR domain-containing protein [Spirochaetales bacterium]
MKKLTLSMLLLVLAAGFLPAQNADVVYIDGWVDLKRAGGGVEEAFFGDLVRVGDSVITGVDGTAELARGTGAHIFVSEDTVFTLMETERNGERQTVLSCTLGSVAFKFQKMTEKEPLVSSPSLVAGIRGTEFTVYTAADGSSLVAVESGRVDIEAAGETVSLEAEEGVEVRPGEAPGEKFQVLRGQIDYSAWSDEKMAAFLEDPAAALGRIGTRMDEYIARIFEFNDHKTRLKQAIEKERAKLEEIKASQGEAAMVDHYKTVIQPMEREEAFSVLNYRYYTLSALSLRRYIMTPLYVTMKTTYLSDQSADTYLSFLEVYQGLLEQYEKGVVPYLVEADF